MARCRTDRDGQLRRPRRVRVLRRRRASTASSAGLRDPGRRPGRHRQRPGPGYTIAGRAHWSGRYKRGTRGHGPHRPAEQPGLAVLHRPLRRRERTLTDPQVLYPYAIFGEVVSGMEVVDAIAAMPPTARSSPIDPVAMTSVTVSDGSVAPSASPAVSPRRAPRHRRARRLARHPVRNRQEQHMTRATIATELGDIELDLYTQAAPKAAQNFVDLANKGFYDDVIFHRVIPGFVDPGRRRRVRQEVDPRTRAASARAGRATSSRTSRSTATTPGARWRWPTPARTRTAASSSSAIATCPAACRRTTRSSARSPRAWTSSTRSSAPRGTARDLPDSPVAMTSVTIYED